MRAVAAVGQVVRLVYDEALAHVTGPALPGRHGVVWSQGLLDVLFEYPIQSDRSPLLDRPAARAARHPDADGAPASCRRAAPCGRSSSYGDPGLVRLDPRWHQAALQFVKLGFFHILDGTDHLLFLSAWSFRSAASASLVAVVTAFTVAHSITLIASAYNLAPDALWFPPLIETLIATSIVYMALENIVGGTSSVQAPRWADLTFGSGSCTGSGSRSRCGRRCSSPARTC